MADSEKVPSTPLASTSRPSEDTPFGRLAAAFRFATQRVDSTDEASFQPFPTLEASDLPDLPGTLQLKHSSLLQVVCPVVKPLTY